MHRILFDGIARNWWRLRLKTLIKWEQKKNVYVLQTWSGIGKTFSASRRQKLSEFLIIVVVFSEYPLSDPTPNSACKCFEPFFPHPFYWTEFFLDIEKLLISWGKKKFYSVSRQLNWLLAWQKKRKEIRKKMNQRKMKISSTNSKTVIIQLD